MSTRRTTGLHERGSSLVEFAIVVTASLTLIMGIVEFGRGLYAYHLISNVARLGARYAIVRGASCTNADCPASQASIQTYVRGLAPELDTNAITVTPAWSTSTGCAGSPYTSAGCLVTVNVAYPFRFVAVPLVPSFIMTIRSSSQMVISQ